MNLQRYAVALMLVTAAPASFAASSVDLSVSGSIVPASCTPWLTTPELDFGKISAKDLNLDKPTRIGGDKSQILGIQCQSAVRFALRGVDNRADTVGNNTYGSPYGLGVTHKNEKIGAHYFVVVPSNSLVDNAPAYATVGNAAGTQWSVSGTGDRAIRTNGELLGFNLSSVSTGPIPITEALFTLKSHIMVAPANTLTLDQDVALDGSATIELVYL
ncbi:MAG: DUF1120 domain-containing protein [Pseudomonas sp.]|nr:DUF1120 domain-containing protein [Pseudomonas sp.]